MGCGSFSVSLSILPLIFHPCTIENFRTFSPTEQTTRYNRCITASIFLRALLSCTVYIPLISVSAFSSCAAADKFKSQHSSHLNKLQVFNHLQIHNISKISLGAQNNNGSNEKNDYRHQAHRCCPRQQPSHSTPESTLHSIIRALDTSINLPRNRTNLSSSSPLKHWPKLSRIILATNPVGIHCNHLTQHTHTTHAE